MAMIQPSTFLVPDTLIVFGAFGNTEEKWWENLLKGNYPLS